jgi:hypothetical protein
MRGKSERHALLLGLAVSALAHALLAMLNPGMQPPATTEPRSPQVTALRRQPLTAFQFEITDAAVAARGRASPFSTAKMRALAEAPDSVAAPAGAGRSDIPLATAPAATRRRARALERLLAVRDPALWTPPKPRVETREERAMREVLARLEKARDEPGFVPPALPPLAPPGGGFGLRIPFGRKPPPPAQVVPAPERLASLAADSARTRGDVLHLYYGGFTLSLPAALRAGVPFQLCALLPSARDHASVRVFIDRVSQGSFTTTGGVANATLTIQSAGSHRILVHIISDTGYPPAELVHVVNVGT